ncbi:NAD-dependent protein lipoamidase sirtuin-4 [Mortierella sp. AD031]|nr:NAD-dependent protein lipoamidase sirtuin-4 [Mortierella sp. AD031]
MKLRISLKSVSKALSTTTEATARIPLATASKELASFLRDGHSNITVLIGAGVSTDSAIPDYRGENGTYTLNPDYKPVFFQAFNVDGLHQKAGARNVIELHGTLHRVKCMTCGHEEDRSDFQQVLADLNPEWNDLLQSQSTSRLYSRMNADGDVELKTPEQQQEQQEQQHQQEQHSNKAKGLDYRTFQYPTCSCCGSGNYKPSVVFFGENVPIEIKEASAQAILESNGLLVIGTSLATYSAFRLVKLAKDTGIPIAMINLGESRGQSLANLRYDENSSLLLKAVAHELGLGDIPGVIKQRKQVMNVVGS